ncbi:MAG: hypothetical protein ABFD18_20565 [Syntrophomonas sp.]
MESINKVVTYTIKQNWIMLSTKPMPIYDENYNIIGYVNCFDKSLGERIFKYLCPIFNNFETKDVDGNIHIRVVQSILFFKRAEWKVELYCNQQKEISFILRDISLTSNAKTLVFEFEGWQITMENNRVNYQTRFIDSTKGVIAQCDRKGIFDIDIQVFKPELDIYLIATLGLVHYYSSLWGR